MWYRSEGAHLYDIMMTSRWRHTNRCSGAFGIVYRAIWRGNSVAVKQIRAEHVQVHQLQDFLNEVTSRYFWRENFMRIFCETSRGKMICTGCHSAESQTTSECGFIVSNDTILKKFHWNFWEFSLKFLSMAATFPPDPLSIVSGHYFYFHNYFYIVLTRCRILRGRESVSLFLDFDRLQRHKFDMYSYDHLRNNVVPPSERERMIKGIGEEISMKILRNFWENSALGMLHLHSEKVRKE